jgi:hypothetical protein
MMRPLKLAALSVVLLALLLLLIAGAYCGVSHGVRALGMDDINSKGVAIPVSVVAGLGWLVLFVWTFIEAVRRFKG